MTAREITRRELLRKGAAGAALGTAALALPHLALAQAPAGGVTGSEAQVGEIYQLQAAFRPSTEPRAPRTSI